MQLTTSVLLFAIGASAAATPHRRHQKFHEKKAVGDVVTATIDGKVVQWTNEYDGGATAVAQATGIAPAAAVAAVETAAAVVATAAVSASSSAAVSAASSVSSGTSAGNSASVSEYTAFCASSSKGKRATLQEIAYKGNVGTGTWGCNMLLVDSSIASQYDHTIKFSGQHTEEQKCVCWNKIGADGGINGWFGGAAVEFSLPVGSEQVVAVDANSQGGCSCGAGSVPVDNIGEWAGTWLEFDMGNTSNDGCSGADVSSLVPQSKSMHVQGMSVCSGGQCSSLKEGATDVKAAYVTGMEADDGVGINLAAGTVVLDVIIDYQG